MVSELRSQIDKLDGQTELYLVLCLLALALFLILLLVACNCAMSCCQCHRNRKKEKRYRDEKHNDDYYQQIHSLLQRQQTVEREWEERRRIRDEYRLVSFLEVKFYGVFFSNKLMLLRWLINFFGN